MNPTLAELFAKTQHLVTHLEMRDTYGTSSASFQAWKAGLPPEGFADFETYRPWVALISEHVRRGVVFRRARVISEPHSEYIRFEHRGDSVLEFGGRRTSSLVAPPHGEGPCPPGL